jgi:hypothetical protein
MKIDWGSHAITAGFFTFIGMVFVILVGFVHCQTRVRQSPNDIVLRRGNFVIGAFTDGWICYGTHKPIATVCHMAVPKPWGDLQ